MAATAAMRFAVPAAADALCPTCRPRAVTVAAASLEHARVLCRLANRHYVRCEITGHPSDTELVGISKEAALELLRSAPYTGRKPKLRLHLNGNFVVIGA